MNRKWFCSGKYGPYKRLDSLKGDPYNRNTLYTKPSHLYRAPFFTIVILNVPNYPGVIKGRIIMLLQSLCQELFIDAIVSHEFVSYILMLLCIKYLPLQYRALKQSSRTLTSRLNVFTWWDYTLQRNQNLEQREEQQSTA